VPYFTQYSLSELCSVTCNVFGVGTTSLQTVFLVVWFSCLRVCEDRSQKDTYAIRAFKYRMACAVVTSADHKILYENPKLGDWMGWCPDTSEWVRELVKYGCRNYCLMHSYWTADLRGFSPIIYINRNCINVYNATVTSSISVEVTCKRCHVNYIMGLPAKRHRTFS
jgi:hypothetical protein